jgi:hypothetical protein
MSTKKDTSTTVAVGVAACAACCAGPILAFLATLGLGTAAGFALFGTVGLLLTLGVSAMLVRRRRQQTAGCDLSNSPEPIAVELSGSRRPR